MSAEALEPDELTRLLELNAWRPLTVHDLPAQDRRFGLIDGELFVVPPMADGSHQRLVGDLTTELNIRRRDPGSGLPAEFQIWPGGNVIAGETTVVMPDVLVIDPRHLVHEGLGISPGGLRLVVEISSPSTRRRDLTEKRDLYERWNTPYILVDRQPTSWQVRVFGELPGWAENLL